MGSSDDFDTLSFEKRLVGLKDTQESIQALSMWCLGKRTHHKKIVASWLNVLKRAKVEQRLTLFYLANDVIQYSKRKNYEFVDSWGTTLQKATPLVRDDKIKHKILRIFRIWEERQIYDDEFLTDLTGLLSVTAGKTTADVDPNDFQAVQLVNKIRQCSVLEADTDQQLKRIHESKIPLNDADNFTKMIRERRDHDEAKKDLDEGILKLEAYVNSLQKELVARAALCRLLQKAHNHYATQRGEVKVVANAYKNFGNRVRGLKRKLDELYQHLPDDGSPIPSPPSFADAVPSPGPDEDLDLPSSGANENSDSFNLDSSFLQNMEKDLAGRGFGTFIGKASFSIASLRDPSGSPGVSIANRQAKKIEVISNRAANPEEVSSLNSLLKTLIPQKPPPLLTKPDSLYQPLLTPPPPPPPLLLPGLDLLSSSDSVDGANSMLRPPNNFYGSGITNTRISSASSDNYPNDNNERTQWSNSWDNQGLSTSDTPESPPIEPLRSPPRPIIPVPAMLPDVDHRQLLAPPPVIPPVLLKSDDIDHRRLPPLPPTHQTQDLNRSHKGDVDHRNLISLTMGGVPPPPTPPIMPPWPQGVVHSDQDYRSGNKEFSTLVPPPLPPMSVPPPSRRLPLHTDNVESIDMEMSDEEAHESHDEDYRHLRLESSMARIHGHPPPPLLPHPNAPSYRKSDISGRDKQPPFIANNNNNNRMHQNLVHINSNNDNIDRDNGDRSTRIDDIFEDFPNDAMNPANPNMSDDNEWERSDDEGSGGGGGASFEQPWQKQRIGGPPPPIGTFNHGRPFNRRQPTANYRNPPPLLGTPIERPFFNPRNHRGNNFRGRPGVGGGGHHRPPRGYW